MRGETEKNYSSPQRKKNFELTYTIVLDRRAVFTQNQTLGRRSKFRKTTDGKIFVVEVGSVAKDFIGLCSMCQQGDSVIGRYGEIDRRNSKKEQREQ